MHTHTFWWPLLMGWVDTLQTCLHLMSPTTTTMGRLRSWCTVNAQFCPLWCVSLIHNRPRSVGSICISSWSWYKWGRDSCLKMKSGFCECWWSFFLCFLGYTHLAHCLVTLHALYDTWLHVFVLQNWSHLLVSQSNSVWKRVSLQYAWIMEGGCNATL